MAGASPTGRLDSRGVPEFPLLNNTAGLYPQLNWIPYPKVGQRNSACRVGVVSAAGGETAWVNVPGSPRNDYIARMQWPKGRRESCCSNSTGCRTPTVSCWRTLTPGSTRDLGRAGRDVGRCAR